MTTYALAAVMTVCVLLLAAVIGFPWLFALGVLVTLRLSPAEATEASPDGWDYEELLAAAVDHGIPHRCARWLRHPRHRRVLPGTGDGAARGGDCGDGTNDRG